MTLRTPPRGLDTARGAEGAGTRPKTRVGLEAQRASCEKHARWGYLALQAAGSPVPMRSPASKLPTKPYLTLQPIGGWRSELRISTRSLLVRKS